MGSRVPAKIARSPWLQPGTSERERLAAGTGARGLGVVEVEALALEPVREVERGAFEVEVGAAVEDDLEPLLLDEAVGLAHHGVPPEVVREPGAAPLDDGDAEVRLREVHALVGGDLAEAAGGGVGDVEGGGFHRGGWLWGKLNPARGTL